MDVATLWALSLESGQGIILRYIHFSSLLCFDPDTYFHQAGALRRVVFVRSTEIYTVRSAVCFVEIYGASAIRFAEIHSAYSARSFVSRKHTVFIPEVRMKLKVVN